MKRNLLVPLLVVLVSAVCFWLGTGLEPWWPFIWLAPLPLLLFAPVHSALKTALVTASAVILGYLNIWSYLRLLKVPPTAIVTILVVIALIFVFATLLFRGLLLRGAIWTATLAFPAVWTVAGYLESLTSVNGTAGNLAYTQLRFLPFLQVASITGPWGMTYLLLLFSSALASGHFVRVTQPLLAKRILFAGLGVIALALVFGTIRLALPHAPGSLKVGLVTSGIAANDDVASEGKPAAELFQSYARESERLAAAGAQVIVLPEKLAVVLPGQTQSELWQALADKTNAVVVVGVIRIETPLRYNEAQVFRPRALMLSYDKEHMLPPFESRLTPGQNLVSSTIASQPVGVAICKDLDFISPARRYGKEGTGLLLAPAWDFNIDRAYHGHIAIMRGVENGYSIARAAKNGYLTVSDNRGRILAEKRSDSAAFPTLLLDVPTAHDSTIYLKFGDWFAWLAIALLGSSLIALVRPRRTKS
jgi:apolipoprotein N-acyltransferase